MRWSSIPKRATPLALLLTLAAVSHADEARPDDRTAIPMAGPASRGVVSGDHFFTIADGRLVDVNLQRRTATTFTEPGGRLVPCLDVSDGKACVATADRVHVIDLETGKIVRSAAAPDGVRGLGFVNEGRVFVVGHSTLAVVSLYSGEARWTIPIPDSDFFTWGAKRRRGGLTGWQKVGKVLYMADSDGQTLNGYDLDSGKVVADVPTTYWWSSAVQVVGDRAFVRGITLNAAINAPQFGWIDLKTKKYTSLKTGEKDETVAREAFDRLTLAAGPDDSVCLAWGGAVLQYDAEGRSVGKTSLPADDAGRLLGVWNGQALMAGKDALKLTPLAKASAATD